jgi:L-ascorbate metabolism protein UlaG (beta-lactamase superfamily)
MIIKCLRALLFIVFLSSGWSLARAQAVKITPLGSHAGEFCQNDRALLFEDPTGVRVLYDAGRTVAGVTDARLGDVHVILLSHAHGDHIGDTKAAGLNAGTCNKPQTASATPNSNTAEIAVTKNSAVMTSRPMTRFLNKRIQNIRGATTLECPAVGVPRVTTVPTSSPCLAGRPPGATWIFKVSGATKGVEVTPVRADHDNSVGRNLIIDPEKSNLDNEGLTAYVGDAIGFVLAFTNGLKVYLSGDTGLISDMKTIINGFYKAKLAVMNISSVEKTAFAVNELIQPNAVILSHANEAATTGGKVNPGTRTRQFIDQVKDRSVHVPLSGKTMEFDENAKCIAGC